jgi:uncharacterized membrane protein YhaH (DUF805 family)
MHWYFDGLRKYARFNGRATRSEYWYFQLFHFMAACLLGFLLGFVGAAVGAVQSTLDGVLAFFVLGVALPNFAVLVRRLHDTGRSGWWALAAFVPLLGFVVLGFCCEDSQPFTNEYGPNPKEVLAA